jgi:RNA polymerase sigma-70 factor (ECF subfamily)
VVPCFIAEPPLRDAASQLEQEVVGLYEEHASALSRYASSFTQNQEGAQDAVQEVFLRYFVERRFGREIANPRAWLYHVLRNYLVDLRRSASERVIIAENLDQMPGCQQNPERILRRSEVARELEALLSTREFECVRLRAEGLEYAEIGEAMGIRTGTVGALLSRAQSKIRRSAGGHESTSLGTAEAIRSLCEQHEAYS